MSRPGIGAPSDTSFARLARAAIEKHVAEARTAEAHWKLGPNLAWVRWSRDGSYFYLALRRHLDWVTGEAGVSETPLEFEQLALIAAAEPPAARPAAGEGWRVRLATLLEGEDRWWPAGATPGELSEQLEWLALQLRVRGEGFFGRVQRPPG